MPGDALQGMCYNIKLSGSGYRLVSRVEDERVVILMIAYWQWERGSEYEVY